MKPPKIYPSVEDAALHIRKWQDWKSAGVFISPFHRDGTPFALPFDPDHYRWGGPVTIALEMTPYERVHFYKGAYRRGVRKYLNRLKKGLEIPPVAYLYHDAWGWTMQDGNHHMEALVKHGATSFRAFLARPIKPQKFDCF